jgi:hypothetical protein
VSQGSRKWLDPLLLGETFSCFGMWKPDQARLLVQRAAWRLDAQGTAAAGTDVAAVNLVTAKFQTRVLDRAMQVVGAMSPSADTPLVRSWAWGRARSRAWPRGGMAPMPLTCGVGCRPKSDASLSLRAVAADGARCEVGPRDAPRRRGRLDCTWPR